MRLEELTKLQGDQLALDLEKYKQDHLKYPQHLADVQALVPKPRLYGSSFAIRHQQAPILGEFPNTLSNISDSVYLQFLGRGVLCEKELPAGPWRCSD